MCPPQYDSVAAVPAGSFHRRENSKNSSSSSSDKINPPPKAAQGMFKFNFDIDDLVDGSELAINTEQQVQPSGNQIDDLPAEEPCKEIPIQELLDSLPSLISCSPLSIPLRDGTKNVTLIRRDLFDARFQLISEGADAAPGPDKAEEEDRGEGKATSNGNVEKHHRHASALQFIEAPSDLVPRVYEGGLKTWECSLDLVEYLDSTYGEGAEGFYGKSVLELGCGTAVPSLYILHHIFSSPPPSDGTPLPETVIYLQDYNESVLELVTLPNILLTWYLSPASHPYRTSNTDEDLPFPIPPEPFDLPLSDSLKISFLQSLTEKYNISLRFFSGSWTSFTSSQLSNIPSTTKTFDLVLTSETIYRMENLPSLVDIMRLACIGPDANSRQTQKKGECLVATKVLYFGVGGGVSDFIDFVDKAAVAKVKTVRERKTGVGRVILSLDLL